MPSVTFEYRSEQERAAIECAVAFVSEMHSLAQTAPDGQVLHACEGHALDAGRDLLRNTLAQAVQARIGHAQKKAARHALAPALAPSTSSATAAAES